ncbi:MAG: DNA translocase FtsK [Planctomycetaceae bacterium]|nr:DNA translocase FtsK [Planctomycetaceae bacterium]
MFDSQRFNKDLMALALLAATVFVGMSLVSFDPADPPAKIVYPARAQSFNLCGMVGSQVAYGLRVAFGIGAYFLLVTMLSLDVRLFSRRESAGLWVEVAGWLLVMSALCIGMQMVAPGLGNGQIIGSGGYLGAWGAALCESRFATGGTLILLLAAFVAGCLLMSELILFRYVGMGALMPFRAARTVAGFRPLKRRRNAQPNDRRGETGLAVDEDETLEGFDAEADDHVADSNADDEYEDEPLDDGESWDLEDEDDDPIKVNPPATGRSDREELMHQIETASQAPSDDDFELPDLDFLEDAESFPYELLAKKARLAAVTLEKTFDEFGLNVKVAEIDTGPVITQFELKLEPGLRVSKVTALADDLAVALRVPSVRIVSSIPGKNTVGVEVPNEKQVMVRLKELLEASQADTEKMRLPLFLGKDVSGHPMAVDLAKMPHLLIAGRTGTGKSVCLNTLILSLLMTRSPDQVKMLMIDPKMVELSPYKRIPHLMHPVITDMKKAEAVLAWAVEKMEERYDLLARCGVRHLDSYNKMGHAKICKRFGIEPDSLEGEAIPESMPYIVIVADEMADMMMTSGKDVEAHIIRLAQKSRAVGIHLVLATQKPTVDVLTGLIKSNLPARVSFQVASRTDSRVVLDEMGAERLLGNGDMLYLAPGTSQVTRAQGTFVSDDEVNGIIDFYSEYEPDYCEELTQISTSGSSGGDLQENRKSDDLYDAAIEVVIREGRGSVSLLQRALGIGYGRGARLIDYMAEDGIVGDYNGSQAREVLYTMEQWDEVKAEDE